MKESEKGGRWTVIYHAYVSFVYIYRLHGSKKKPAVSGRTVNELK